MIELCPNCHKTHDTGEVSLLGVPVKTCPDAQPGFTVLPPSPPPQRRIHEGVDVRPPNIEAIRARQGERKKLPNDECYVCGECCIAVDFATRDDIDALLAYIDYAERSYAEALIDEPGETDVRDAIADLRRNYGRE